MANIFSSFQYTVVLTAFALAAPVGFALQPLSSEQNRRAPALTTMVAFSPLAITGYVLLAIMTSYALLRLYHFLKPRILSSVTKATLPQPVSAGRTSSLSFLYSPLSLWRSRQKSTSKSTPTRSRWPPLTSLFRRLTRPSSPLHLSGAEVLPTTMPNSPSNTHSLMNLPVMSSSAPKNHSYKFKESTKQLSRSSSMDTLPSYRPLTPVPVLVPLPVYTVPPPPATPPPPSPTSLLGTTDSDIPLVPITPPKRKYTPANTTSPSGMPTPPPTSVFPAISLSPFKPSTSTTAQSNNVVVPKPSPPSPNLFLSSRTLSSLSLSPRSLYLQQHKRSKSLGGVAVKKIPTPQFHLDDSETEYTEDVADSTTDADREHAHTLIVPALEKEKSTGKSALAPPKFLLNFSSSSSSSTSDSSLSSDLLSPSPLTSNSGSTPASAPLRTPRTTSNSSYSSDIAKPSEHESLLPRPIPLVDVDMSVDMDMMMGFSATEKGSGWGLDIEEPVVERVLADFGMPVVGAAYTKAGLVGLGMPAEQRVEEKLIDVEDVDAKAAVEHGHEDRWEWDNDLQDHDGWNLGTETEEATVPHLDVELVGDPGVSGDEEEEDVVLPSTPSPTATTLAKELNIEETMWSEMEADYPDPELLSLPETISILPPLLAKPVDHPAISICTQDSVLREVEAECNSSVASASPTGRATPISPGQIPTPPASPPREVRAAPLPKVNKDSHESSLVTVMPVGESPVTIDIDAPEEETPTLPFVMVVEKVKKDDEGLLAPEERRQEDREEEEEIIIPLLGGPLVSSPASMSVDLEGSDNECGWTFNVEAADEECGGDGDIDSDNDSGVGVEIVPPSPCDRVVGWEYGSDHEEDQEEQSETEEVQAVLPPSIDRVVDLECAHADRVDVTIRKQLAASEEPGDEEDVRVEEHTPGSGTSEAETQLETPLEPTSLPVIAQVEVSVAEPVSAPVLEPSTSLPGAFPTGTLPSEPEPEVRSLSPEPSPQPQIRRRIRTPLEEAIFRTRSPLEVALAMQLRPGLGLGADPAWMVRFLMVMWGWMFGMVLVPSAEA